MDSASILFSASASERCYMRSRRLSAAQPTVSMQASAIQACLNIAERSLSYAKIAKILEMSIDRVISCLYEVNGVFPL